MLHLILTLCQKVEKAFNKIVDGGEGGEGPLLLGSKHGHTRLHDELLGSVCIRTAVGQHLPLPTALVVCWGDSSLCPFVALLVHHLITPLAPYQVVSACWRCLM